MNMDNQEIIKEIETVKNLSKSTCYVYKVALELYSEFNKMPLYKLILEADREEEEGIRWKNRSLKRRLILFRNFLYNDCNIMGSSAKTYFAKVLTFYRFNEIEIHNLPDMSTKNVKRSEEITFKDLPDNQIIKRALKISAPMMRAIILFMSSSGCARAETLSLKISHFVEATKNYHNSDNIYEIINLLKSREDIVPLFHIRRIKTDKYYHTCCSPEAVSEVINYLLTREDELTLNSPLFDVCKDTLDKKFRKINEDLGLGKAGTYNTFRTHNLRKFHSSNLRNDKLSKEYIHELQGRGKNNIDEAYIKTNPEMLREIYIEHMNAVTINLDVNNIDIKSPEFIELESKYEEKEQEIEYYKDKINKQSEFNREVEIQMSNIQTMLKKANMLKKMKEEDMS